MKRGGLGLSKWLMAMASVWICPTAFANQEQMPLNFDAPLEAIEVPFGCDQLLFVHETEIKTPYQNHASRLDGFTKLLKASRMVKELTPEQQDRLALMAFNASFQAQRPISPEFMMAFLSRRPFESLGQMTRGIHLNMKTRMQLLKIHLQMNRDLSIREARYTYFDYLTVLKGLKSTTRPDAPEAITALRLWRVHQHPFENVVQEKSPRPLAGQFIPIGIQIRRLLLLEHVTEKQGQIATPTEQRNGQYQSESLNKQYDKEAPFLWDDRIHHNSQVDQVTIRHPMFWALLRAMRSGEPVLPNDEAFRFRMNLKASIEQVYFSVLKTKLPIEPDAFEFDFGLLGQPASRQK